MALQMRERTPDIEDTAPKETQDDVTALTDLAFRRGSRDGVFAP